MSDKVRTMNLSLDPNIKTVKAGNMTVWSHDKDSFKIMFDIDDGCGGPLILTDAKPRILMILGDSPIQVFDLEIVSEHLGQAFFKIPERILGYQGRVKASVYVDYEDKTHDLGSFDFDMRKSEVDNDMPELTFYVESIDNALKKADELEDKINRSDLVTHPELDKELANVARGMVGSYNSVAKLNAEYPQGAKGFALVDVDTDVNGQMMKVPHTFIWDGSQWIDRGPFNGVELGKKSVDNKKLNLVGAEIPVLLDFNISPPEDSNVPNSSTRFFSESLILKQNDRVTLNDSNYQFATFDFLTGKVISQYANYFESNTECKVVFSIKKIDNSKPEIVDLTKVTNSFIIFNNKMVANYDILQEETKRLIKENTDIPEVPQIFSTNDKEYNDLLLENKITNKSEYTEEKVSVVTKTYFEKFLGSPSVYSEDEILYCVIKTKHDDKSIEKLMCLRQRIGSTSPFITYSTYVGGGVYFIAHKINHSVQTGVLQFLIDNRTGSYQIEVEEITIGRNYIYNDINFSSDVENKTFFVAFDGSDSDSGLESGKPFKTFKKAIDSGATKIIAKRGVYKHQTINCTDGRDLEIIPYGTKTYNKDNLYDVPKIVIDNGDNLKATGEGINKIPFSAQGNNRFKQVFTDKILPPKTSGSRPSYNVGVWQHHLDQSKDLLLEPVLTLSECESTQGTIFWDGTTLTLNPKDTGLNPTSFTVHSDANVGVTITKSNKVKIKDVISQFSYSRNYVIHDSNIEIQNSDSFYTVLLDGFSLDGSNGNLYHCIAKFARNDGYNMHGFGDTHFWSCEGHFNGDDGISHHDGCTGSITGGHWSFNGKSGIAPTYGSIIHLYGNYAHNNPYNCYCAGETGNQKRVVRHFDNVFINAIKSDYRINEYYQVLSKGNIYKTIEGEEHLIKLDA